MNEEQVDDEEEDLRRKAVAISADFNTKTNENRKKVENENKMNTQEEDSPHKEEVG